MKNAKCRIGTLLVFAFCVLTSTFGSAVRLTGSGPVSPGQEEGAFLLLVEPAEEFLKSRIGLDFLDGIKRIPQFVVRPGFVNEIFARVAGRDSCGPAFAARDDMVPSSMDRPLTKHASFGHNAASQRQSANVLRQVDYLILITLPF